MDWLLAFLAAYLVGSIPFGLLLAMAAGKGDIRQIGSGNIGATNVLRTGNKGLAAATLLLDLAKGFAAVLIARQFWPDAVGLAAVAAALMGEMQLVPWLSAIAVLILWLHRDNIRRLLAGEEPKVGSKA